MSLFERGIRIGSISPPPVGKRVRRSTGTSNKAQAQEFYDKLNGIVART
jgi:hypothetical protein